MKILAVLVNYGNQQLDYLQKVVSELKSFNKYDVTVRVNSNIELDNIQGIDHVEVVRLNNYQMLPMTCRNVIWHYRKDFDIFLFGENDHLFKEVHIDNHIKYTNLLPDDRISGLIQYEQDDKGKFYPAYHANYDWDFESVEEYDGLKFAHFNNLHQATFILTKEQLLKIGEIYDFTKFFGESHYSMKCKTNTDIFQFCRMKKLICISEFENNLIHHLPDIYIKGERGRNSLGSSEFKMYNSLKRLLKND